MDSVLASAAVELSLVLTSANKGCCGNQDTLSPSDCFCFLFLSNFVRFLRENPTEGLDKMSHWPFMGVVCTAAYFF